MLQNENSPENSKQKSSNLRPKIIKFSWKSRFVNPMCSKVDVWPVWDHFWYPKWRHFGHLGLCLVCLGAPLGSFWWPTGSKQWNIIQKCSQNASKVIKMRSQSHQNELSKCKITTSCKERSAALAKRLDISSFFSSRREQPELRNMAHHLFCSRPITCHCETPPARVPSNMETGTVPFCNATCLWK